MAPTLVRPPFHRDGWVYEEKVDGWRILAYKDGPRVRLISRNAVDHTARFRELAAAIARLRARETSPRPGTARSRSIMPSLGCDQIRRIRLHEVSAPRDFLGQPPELLGNSQ